MNDAEKIYNLLTTMQLPVAYDHFTTKVTPPFILYKFDNADALFADDHTFFRKDNFSVWLVTDLKDVALEKQLETIFDNNFIPYEKSETFIASERIYQVSYEI